MKRLAGVKSLVMAVLMAAAAPASAQQSLPNPSATAPFLVLDEDRLYEESAFGLRVIEELKARAEAFGEENIRIGKALEDEERRLTNERAGMEPAAFRELAVDFDERVTAIRQAQAAKQAAINQYSDNERNRFFEISYPFLFSLVQETGAVAILKRSAIIFPVRNIDITDAAIARIDAEIGASEPEPVAGPQPVPRPNDQQ